MCISFNPCGGVLICSFQSGTIEQVTVRNHKFTQYNLIMSFSKAKLKRFNEIQGMQFIVHIKVKSKSPFTLETGFILLLLLNE